MTVSWSINTLAVAKLVPLRPGLERCDEQDEKLGERGAVVSGWFESHGCIDASCIALRLGICAICAIFEIYIEAHGFPATSCNL